MCLNCEYKSTSRNVIETPCKNSFQENFQILQSREIMCFLASVCPPVCPLIAGPIGLVAQAVMSGKFVTDGSRVNDSFTYYRRAPITTILSKPPRSCLITLLTAVWASTCGYTPYVDMLWVNGD